MNLASEANHRTDDLPLAPRRLTRQIVHRQEAETTPLPGLMGAVIQMTSDEKEPPSEGQEGSIDVVKIAEKVYQMMRRDLILEAERFPRRR